MFSCNEERSIRPPILVHLLIQQGPHELGQILVLQLPPMSNDNNLENNLDTNLDINIGNILVHYIIQQGLLGLEQIHLASAGVQGERATLVTMIGSRWFGRTFGKNNATKDIVR